MEPAAPAIVAPTVPGPSAGGAVAMEQAEATHDLSPLGMYRAADAVVKGVLIGLLLASVIAWTVTLAKTVEIIAARSRLRRALAAILAAPSLAAAETALAGARGPGVAMVMAARREADVSSGAIATAGGQGMSERVTSLLARAEAHAATRLAAGLGLLATIGAIAPFVGLFGTVWGIMNSFIGIANSRTTDLAVVAPGIAEALLATGLGLAAAIPAVVAYNAFARSIARHRGMLADAAAGIERLVSRDLDFRRFDGAALRRAAE